MSVRQLIGSMKTRACLAIVFGNQETTQETLILYALRLKIKADANLRSKDYCQNVIPEPLSLKTSFNNVEVFSCI